MAMPGEVDIGTLIERRPGVYGGRPVLKGTRFPVIQVAALIQDGWDAGRIHGEYLADVDISLVYAAIAYYHANRQTVDAELNGLGSLQSPLTQDRRSQQCLGER